MTAMDLKQPLVIDELISFEEDYTDPVTGTQLIIKREQDIPEDYISQLKADKIDTLHDRFGNHFYRVAHIPTSVVQKWDREGFNIDKIAKEDLVKEVLKVLNRLDMDAFITTRKKLY